ASPFAFYSPRTPRPLPSFPTRRSSDLFPVPDRMPEIGRVQQLARRVLPPVHVNLPPWASGPAGQNVDPLDRRHLNDLQAERHGRSEEHTSELQSRENLVCRLLLEKKN